MEFFVSLCRAVCSATEFHLRRYAWFWVGALIGIVCIGTLSYLFLAPPHPFPSGSIFVVAQGEAAPAIARNLADAGVIAHPRVLRLLWRVSGTGGDIPAGAYRFAGPIWLPTVAWRLARGAHGIPPTRITFAEGTTVLDMAGKIAKAFPEISAPDFISAAQPYEGYLFPDTYTFEPSASAESITETLRDTFDAKMVRLSSDILASGHSLSDIVILASIVEREARTETDRHMIAGIMWNRIEKGMPLQVDAVFGYIYSRQTYSPSYHDLGVDSPYNTYRHKGLPPGPISNPGLDSLDAALHPTKTDYLYYLTGTDGFMHYATTYAGHTKNLRTYLR